MIDTEQWLSDGKCHICRRREYCSKPCTKCKSRRQYEMRKVIRSSIARILTGRGGTGES